MPKYHVTVWKTETYHADIEIEAQSLAQAESMAEDDAQHKPLDWSYQESEIGSVAFPIEEVL